jgi:signal transduction histidine kinase
VLVSCAITFVVVYRDTGSELRHQIDHDIAGEESELSQALLSSKDHLPASVARRATRYIQSEPFSASSTLLFAIVPGAPTSSNRPELVSTDVKPDNGETFAEQARENHAAARVLSIHDGYSTVEVPDVGALRLLKETVSIPGGPRVTIGAGEPLAAVAHAQGSIARAFVLAGILALVGALVAAYLVGTRISRPLRRMAAVAARVDAGDLHPRIHGVARQADELRVLADAFNHMLDRLTEAFAGQRAFVADASHELRTPLTVIRGQLEVLAGQRQPSEVEVRRVERLVQAEIARITRLVDDLLLLTKAEQTEFLRIQSVELPLFVRELWDGMSLLAVRRFELGSVAAGALRADSDWLAQALRNLIGNAIEHTAEEEGLVRLRVEARAGGWIAFIVEDDGPGIAPDQRERVFERFHRTDAARDRASGGTGLGLAIVRAIAEAHGGRVAVGDADGGRAAVGGPGGGRAVVRDADGGPALAGEVRARGARIELELPGFLAEDADGPSEEALSTPGSAPGH